MPLKVDNISSIDDLATLFISINSQLSEDRDEYLSKFIAFFDGNYYVYSASQSEVLDLKNSYLDRRYFIKNCLEKFDITWDFDDIKDYLSLNDDADEILELVSFFPYINLESIFDQLKELYKKSYRESFNDLLKDYVANDDIIDFIWYWFRFANKYNKWYTNLG